VLVYNEAYAGLIADKHPSALGSRAQDVFPEAWAAIGPMMERVYAGHGANWVEDEHVPLRRNGRLEECYFTFSYSPVRAQDGTIEGVMDIATETTREVLDRRRLSLLTQLGVVLSEVEHADEVPARALPVLRTAVEDLPWVDIRLGEGPAEDADGRLRSLSLASRRTSVQGALDVELSEHLVPDGAYEAFLRLIAGSLGQALDRAAALEAERGITVAMQRDLLASPPDLPGIDIAVRYRPAAERAQIGGDWYDAFELRNGRLTIVVGDVTGHDANAAAAMAQVRNLLRGIAYTCQEPPATVLAGLDDAMQGLAIDVFATAILGQLEGNALEWCNAGHLPPVLVEPGGAAHLLATPPEAMLGIAPADRRDHRVVLEPGAALVIYTDGLIERRGVSLTDSLRWLVSELDGCAGMAAEEIADHVIARIEEPAEDDIALLVLRMGA
jgi:hypothetical protein